MPLDSLQTFNVNCTCIDQGYCFSNYSLDGTAINSNDMFEVVYNTYMFDNVHQAKSERIYQDALGLKT